jgi:hypothetical protein
MIRSEPGLEKHFSDYRLVRDLRIADVVFFNSA